MPQPPMRRVLVTQRSTEADGDSWLSLIGTLVTDDWLAPAWAAVECGQ